MYVSNAETCGAARRPKDPAAVEGGHSGAEQHVRTVLGQRALSRITEPVEALLREHGLTEFRLAGGAMLRGTPKDLDIWPPNRDAYPRAFNAFKRSVGVFAPFGSEELPSFWRPKDLVASDGTKVQVCWSTAASLADLIRGFDFAHCQVGAEMSLNTGSEQAGLTSVAWTAHFTNAMLVQGTYYVAGASNINSLARVPEVALKLGLDRGETRALALQIVDDITKDPAGDLERFKRFER